MKFLRLLWSMEKQSNRLSNVWAHQKNLQTAPQNSLALMQENTTKIRNIKQYMKAALFNAPSTIGSYYTSLVSHDMYGGRTIQSARSKGIPDYTCNEGESL